MIGETIGHYRVTARIGEGGMGEVYRATDALLGREVALKLLRPETTQDPDRRARFLQEARAASGLNHPNIVTIYEIGYAGETTYIAMEYVRGKPMDQLVRPAGLAIRDVLALAVQIVDALAAAHAAGIIHRDLKPPNIMVTEQQRVKLLDFGLAKPLLVGLDDHAQSLTHSAYLEAPFTREGMILGTVGYMSPEQLEGRTVDQRSDIFSFGCVLHEMITGQAAFHGDSLMSTLIAVASREPAPLTATRTDVPAELERLVSRCLQKKPEERPQHISEVKSQLEALAAQQESPWPAISRYVGRIRPLRILLWAGVVTTVVAIAVLGVRWRQPAPAASLATAAGPLTTDTGLTLDPAVSRDGRLLAYASDRAGTGGLDIWVRPLAGAESTQLTSHAMDDYNPSFSPDGSLIAFRSERSGGGIYVVPTEGGPERLIAGNGQRPRFSPDGKWIAYWVGAPGGSNVRAAAAGDAIYLAPAGGGPSREWLAGWGSASVPVWAPDGRHLLFFGLQAGSDRMSGSDWWIAPIEDGPPERTDAITRLREEPYRMATPELWLPDNRIIFSRPSDRGTSLWQVQLDPATNKVTARPERLSPDVPIEVHPALTPDGRLVVGRLAETLNIWMLQLDPNRGTPAGTLARLTQGAFIDAAPSTTPDGKKIAFISNRLGRDEVWMHDLDTGRQVALTDSPAFKVFPILDRSGSRLAYAQVEDSKYAIYVMSPGGGKPQRVCPDCGQPRSWVPQSDRILYQHGTPGGFWTLDVATGAKEAAAAYDFGVYSPRFSFDERWLVFHARIHPDATRIMIAPYRGAIAPPSEWVEVTSGLFEDDKPRWAPGDSAIYFLSLRDGSRCLWLQRLEATTKKPLGEPEAVLHFHAARLGTMQTPLNQLDLAVARDKLLLNLTERTGNIWISAGKN